MWLITIFFRINSNIRGVKYKHEWIIVGSLVAKFHLEYKEDHYVPTVWSFRSRLIYMQMKMKFSEGCMPTGIPQTRKCNILKTLWHQFASGSQRGSKGIVGRTHGIRHWLSKLNMTVPFQNWMNEIKKEWKIWRGNVQGRKILEFQWLSKTPTAPLRAVSRKLGFQWPVPAWALSCFSKWLLNFP